MDFLPDDQDFWNDDEGKASQLWVIAVLIVAAVLCVAVGLFVMGAV